MQDVLGFFCPNKAAKAEEADKPSVLLVDPFAAGRGHHLDDDRFLAECIAPLAGEFLVVTSPASAANVRSDLKVRTREIEAFDNGARLPRLRLLRLALALPCSQFRHVVYQSFEELSTLLFMALHPGKRVHLIVTNNLRPDRLKRHSILGGLILRAVFRLAASAIVHCQHEADRMMELVPGIDPGKVFVKPFHQIGVRRARLSWQQKTATILFLGPERPHKRIDPVVDLIKRDKDRRYRYVFCAMRDMAPDTRAFLEAQENVELSFGYVSDDEYYRLFSKAALVILTHDEDFEGALSGAFCDAIASGTAVVVRDMPPHDEFFQRFGPMGFLVDYADPEWCDPVLNGDLATRYEEFQRNMAACGDSCGMEANRAIFRTALHRV